MIKRKKKMNDDASDKLAKDTADKLMGRRVCAACDGEGAVLEQYPGHEECCGPDYINCQSCGGRGWEKI